MNIYEKLSAVQQELKAPKDKKNTFGGYTYRSAEGILEAVKPVLKKYGSSIILFDTIEATGGRIYVKATAQFVDTKEGGQISVTAYAREAETKKGLDDSQITGTASSYARKYALNGLLLIDDTKDADTDEYARQTKAEKRPSVTEELRDLAKKAEVPESSICTQAGVDRLEDIDAQTFAKVKTALLNKIRFMGGENGASGKAD